MDFVEGVNLMIGVRALISILTSVTSLKLFVWFFAVVTIMFISCVLYEVLGGRKL